jgi:succinate dehydrogenase/fumarate reductase flavoprotein subunit
MGGIPTNYKTEVIDYRKGKDVVVPGLLAAGEAACASVHGANRLGANSLLDIVVFGRAAAHRTKELFKPGQSQPDLPKDAGEKTLMDLDKLRHSKGSSSVASIRREMQKTMQKHAAVFRIDKLLKEGCEKMEGIYGAYSDVGIKDRGLTWNTDLIEAL